jgi:hypothetical protein
LSGQLTQGRRGHERVLTSSLDFPSMGLDLPEFFGYDPRDLSAAAVDSRNNRECPFVPGPCVKMLGHGIGAVASGACSVQQVRTPEIVTVCPIRLYQHQYQVLLDVAQSAFGPGARLIRPEDADLVAHDGDNVVVFGKRSGHELRIPRPAGASGSFYVDWVLARLSAAGNLSEFVALEVQTIDTTGNYRDTRDAYLAGAMTYEPNPAGLNWENVSKRILPQVIYKGHVLRREPLCTKGLYFVTPTAVFMRIMERLGGVAGLTTIHPSPGSITFKHYGVGALTPGMPRNLVAAGELTTTVDQLALAFTAPRNLPAARSYEAAIRRELP